MCRLHGSFNGLQNYRVLVSNNGFWSAIINTFLLTPLALLQIPIGYIIACLINSNTNIIDIGMHCGFSSVSSFNRTFKKAVGITPSAFRKRHIGEKQQ